MFPSELNKKPKLTICKKKSQDTEIKPELKIKYFLSSLIVKKRIKI